MDGHYKLNYGGRCTLPIGLLSKHCARTSVRGADGTYIWTAWLTQINPLCFAIAASEAEEARSIELESVAVCIDTSVLGKFPLFFL